MAQQAVADNCRRALLRAGNKMMFQERNVLESRRGTFKCAMSMQNGNVIDEAKNIESGKRKRE